MPWRFRNSRYKLSDLLAVLQYNTLCNNTIKRKINVPKMKAWVVEDTRNVDATIQFAALFVAAAALAVLLQDPLTNSIIIIHVLTKRRADGIFCFLMMRPRIRHPHYKVYKNSCIARTIIINGIFFEFNIWFIRYIKDYFL